MRLHGETTGFVGSYLHAETILVACLQGVVGDIDEELGVPGVLGIVDGVYLDAA